MADSRSRRPTSPSRRRVAGTRKRSTRDDSAPEQTVPTEVSEASTSSDEDSPNSGDGAATERIEPDTAGEQDSHGEAEKLDEPDTAEVDSVPEATTKRATSEADTVEADTVEADAANSTAAESNAAESESGETGRTLVMRDGLVELSETSEAETSEGGDEGSAALEPRTVESSIVEAGTTPMDSQPAARSNRRWLLPVLAGLIVVFAGLAFWFQTNVSALRNEGPASNDALVDSGVTAEVNGQIKTAVEKVFSYDHANTGKTEKAAKELLVGSAVDEYNRLFATVKKQAPQQKLVVTTTVKKSAVSYLQGDRARLLLFVDQNAARDGKPGNIVPAQITVGAEKKGDQWRINEIIQR